MVKPPDAAELLSKARSGDPCALDQLIPMVYDALRNLAGRIMHQERQDHTLQATALAHEAYLKLVGQRNTSWQDQAHFLAVAAEVIRRILLDHARGRQREKRGGGRMKLLLDSDVAATYEKAVDLLELDEMLEKLAATHPEQARIVEMRFFAGLTVEEVASVLCTSTRTVERKWRHARAWLFRALTGNGMDEPLEPGDDG